SDEPGGPSYDWVEISGIGTASGVTSDDAEGGPFTLGFDFDYYGNTYSQIYIHSNGFISFTSNGSGLYSNGGIPNSDSPNNILAPFWDDLSPNNGGTIYYYADAANQRFIVEYDNVPHYSYSGNEGPYTFQVIINANGSIKYQYNNMNTPLEEATIGIENNDGTDGLQVVYNAAYVYDGLAILFSRGASWLAYDSFAGDILPGDSVNVKLTFNSSGLTEGIYNSLLSIENNGVNPVVQKTVTMTVQQLTSVNDGINNLPAKYELQQNYPNPFNPATTIKYNLLEAHNVTLKIYNILGEEVRTLVSNKHQPAKSYRVEWNGKDNTGRMVASGMYIYHIEAGSFIQSKKMILLK
ncbi:MAG: T9SS type A sorting domain-containing protein, partial [Calditrichia bacterium]|nr:T9SS type A sorting domain-containing protein [Calditrichia bacterium]